MQFIYIKTLNFPVFKRMLEVLEAAALEKFGTNVKYIPLIMDELLPDRFGIELWAYK